MQQDLLTYHQQLDETSNSICTALYQAIQQHLVGAEHKVWHAHPVWFINGNPIVGYQKMKSGIRLLFWSGQSFENAGLVPEGKFKAAEKRYHHANEIDLNELEGWLKQAQVIQWDYKNIVKRKGELVRLS